MNTQEKSAVARYFDTTAELDEARLYGTYEEVERLEKLVKQHADAARFALEEERKQINAQVHELFRPILSAFSIPEKSATT